MAKDTRKLGHNERHVGLFSSEKGRDKAQAQRAIEGLTQNDQIIALLSEQNDLLRYMSERLAAIEINTKP